MTYVIAILCGLLGVQFLAQAATSFSIMLICLAGIAFSKVDRAYNVAGVAASLAQAVVFAGLLYGVYWAAARWLDLSAWHGATIALAVAAGFSLLFCIAQVPGKLLLTKRTAWDVGFYEVMTGTPVKQRVALAQKWRKEMPRGAE